jgi:hypothetical protein
MQSPAHGGSRHTRGRMLRFNPLRAALRIKPDFALNRPVEDWGKLLGDAAAVSAMLDRYCTTATCSSADHKNQDSGDAQNTSEKRDARHCSN